MYPLVRRLLEDRSFEESFGEAHFKQRQPTRSTEISRGLWGRKMAREECFQEDRGMGNLPRNGTENRSRVGNLKPKPKGLELARSYR